MSGGLVVQRSGYRINVLCCRDRKGLKCPQWPPAHSQAATGNEKVRLAMTERGPVLAKVHPISKLYSARPHGFNRRGQHRRDGSELTGVSVQARSCCRSKAGEAMRLHKRAPTAILISCCCVDTRRAVQNVGRSDKASLVSRSSRTVISSVARDTARLLSRRSRSRGAPIWRRAEPAQRCRRTMRVPLWLAARRVSSTAVRKHAPSARATASADNRWCCAAEQPRQLVRERQLAHAHCLAFEHSRMARNL